MRGEVIILEGVDKTGKSTLAKDLSALTGYPVVHLSVPPEDVDYEKHLISLIAFHPDGVIFDRFHLGDYVYAGLTREEPALSPRGFVNVERHLANRSAVIVYCWAELKDLQRRFVEDGETLIPSSEISRLQARYVSILKTSELPKVLYNFEHDSYKQNQGAEIKKRINAARTS